MTTGLSLLYRSPFRFRKAIVNRSSAHFWPWRLAPVRDGLGGRSKRCARQRTPDDGTRRASMALDPSSRARFNLDKAAVLLLDDTPMGMSILVQIVTGLGAKQLYRCTTLEEAQEVVCTHEIDLAIIDAMAPKGAGYEF